MSYKVVCEDLCVTSFCVKNGVCVCGKVMCETWCVTKLCV